MKHKIIMYLFIFSVLLLIFQYVNSKNIIDKYETDIVTVKAQLSESEKTVKSLEEQNFEMSYFNIDRNEDALTYFEAQGYNTEKLIPAILDGLYSMNDYEGDDHPIVPYVSMTDSKLLINKIRILNHKWIIANFTDGEFWGEIFVSYEIDDNNQLKYKLVEYLMYPTIN
ncbi:thioredoxin domain-containing protein [Winogradskyella bathintestinalis]|uniref:Hydrolase n=1 Tax=Winogradskyella bathintestinalis TaxID=3035208 RepID=A0ABT7ZVW1_9FLAO|nr:hydrolase [Winogradskyella bathintestinalis]MDN3493128.1 hydrolase [Winogradskyella bathintestinalis]